MGASRTELTDSAVLFLQTREVHGPVPPELWRSIAASLALSPAQQQNCVLVCASYVLTALLPTAFCALETKMRQVVHMVK
jgi:hypothetical protein